MTPALRSYFADYAAFHGTPGNKACHMVGIPLIVLAIFAFLAQVPLFELAGVTVTLAEALLVIASVYYVTLDVGLAVLMFAASAVLCAVSRFVPVSVAAALFVAGWVFQYVGHYVYEKRSPAFYRNLVHLLIGPLWILAKATRRA